MAKLKIHTATGDLSVPFQEKMLLSDILRSCGRAPEMPCGGTGRCGKCRVKVSGALSEPSDQERALLSADEIEKGIRLACCTWATGDAELFVDSKEGGKSKICVEGIITPLGNDPLFKNLGVAIDIGTTTLAAALYGKNGVLATAVASNPQKSWGADVITRIGKAMEGEAPALAHAIQEAIGSLMVDLCKQSGKTSSEIDGVVITGNTAMLHLLTETDPSPLAASPFQAKELFGKEISAGELHLPCAPDAVVYLTRCISAFVGGDIVTAILASGIREHPETALLADIGTNGEIALWCDGKLTCCSTAAGPAFEGANLSHGMQGKDGAIDHVQACNGKLIFHTIGEKPAIGICGSGVADLLAALLELDILDETGLLDDGDEDEWPLEGSVTFTQGDIRQVQLAKSAIRSGIETLIKKAGLTESKIHNLAIAGGFGSYLSLDSAAAIGLIPSGLKTRCQILGNAALSGAAMILWNQSLRKTCREWTDQTKTIELATDPFFMDQYIENMMFE